MLPRRLYLRLYLSFLGVLVAVLGATIGVTLLLGRGSIHFFFRQAPRFAEHLARALPPLDDQAALTRALEQFHEELGIDALVVDLKGQPLASAGTRDTVAAVAGSPFGSKPKASSRGRSCSR